MFSIRFSLLPTIIDPASVFKRSLVQTVHSSQEYNFPRVPIFLLCVKFHLCHLLVYFTSRLSVCRRSRAGVGVPSTCCFAPQSALYAGASTVRLNEVQATWGATHTRSCSPQILHNSFKRSNTHAPHVLQVEDVRRQLIYDMIGSHFEHTFSYNLLAPKPWVWWWRRTVSANKSTSFSGLWSTSNNL